MDIEELGTITYEKLLSSYSAVPQLGLDQIAKAIDKRASLEILPPFVVVHIDTKEELQIGFEQLVSIWTTYINKGFPKSIIKIGDDNIFYITRYEDGVMVAKNQDGYSLIFVGKFALGEIVLFSTTSSDAEKLLRLRSLMSIQNTIQQKTRQSEKKKSEK